MPIDINSIRADKGKLLVKSNQQIGGDPQKVKDSIKARFKDETVVDEILVLDEKWRKCKFHKIPEEYVFKDILQIDTTQIN